MSQVDGPRMSTNRLVLISFLILLLNISRVCLPFRVRGETENGHPMMIWKNYSMSAFHPLDAARDITCSLQRLR